MRSRATTINDAGQVAGEAITTSPVSAPDDVFIYDPVAKFLRVSGLIQDPADLALWNIQTADGIESPDIHGMSEPLVPGGYPLLVGNKRMRGSLFADGIARQVGFILKPISSVMSSALVSASLPEPATFLLVSIGLVPLVVRRGR
jgi:hypothetical protein